MGRKSTCYFVRMRIRRVGWFASLMGLSALAAAQTAPGLPAGPTTAADRGRWYLTSTVGPVSLLGAGTLSAAWNTMLNSPKSYGGTWEGFGKRYAMRLSGVAIGNAAEASLGALWGEDPRYYASPERSFKSRTGHVIKLTFLARQDDGSLMPAYGRYVGTLGNNLVTNAWRPKDANDLGSALARTAYGFLGRMGSNAFAEFWPSVKKKLRRK